MMNKKKQNYNGCQSLQLSSYNLSIRAVVCRATLLLHFWMLQHLGFYMCGACGIYNVLFSSSPWGRLLFLPGGMGGHGQSQRVVDSISRCSRVSIQVGVSKCLTSVVLRCRVHHFDINKSLHIDCEPLVLLIQAVWPSQRVLGSFNGLYTEYTVHLALCKSLSKNTAVQFINIYLKFLLYMPDSLRFLFMRMPESFEFWRCFPYNYNVFKDKKN